MRLAFHSPPSAHCASRDARDKRRAFRPSKTNQGLSSLTENPENQRGNHPAPAGASGEGPSSPLNRRKLEPVPA